MKYVVSATTQRGLEVASEFEAESENDAVQQFLEDPYTKAGMAADPFEVDPTARPGTLDDDFDTEEDWD